MRKTEIFSHLSPQDIRKRMLASESRQQFQRWQVIYIMSAKGFGAKMTAHLVGVAKGTVHQWVHQYNHKGPNALDLLGRGGRRKALMSWLEEEALLEKMKAKAKKGEVVIARTVRERVEGKLGRKVSKDYAYDLLHRHGWRKILPRPRHPKGDPSVREEFKKNYQPLWMPPPTPSIRKIPDH
jgi:transposase